MTQHVGVDVEGKWPDGFNEVEWDQLFYLDNDPVRQILNDNGLLDGRAHSFVSRHHRDIFRIGVMPIADESGNNRGLLRVLFNYFNDQKDQVDDFMIEPSPPQIDPDQPLPPSNVWRLHADSTKAPLGVVPLPVYVRESDTTLIATTHEYEKQFDQLMAGAPRPEDVEAFLGLEACFGDPIDRHDVQQASIQYVPAEKLGSQ